MNGIIEGGWSYVWTAYGLSAGILALYATSVLLRLRGEHRRTPSPAMVREEPRR